jgi:hypothetical protein
MQNWILWLIASISCALGVIFLLSFVWKKRQQKLAIRNALRRGSNKSLRSSPTPPLLTTEDAQTKCIACRTTATSQLCAGGCFGSPNDPSNCPALIQSVTDQYKACVGGIQSLPADARQQAINKCLDIVQAPVKNCAVACEAENGWSYGECQDGCQSTIDQCNSNPIPMLESYGITQWKADSCADIPTDTASPLTCPTFQCTAAGCSTVNGSTPDNQTLFANYADCQNRCNQYVWTCNPRLKQCQGSYAGVPADNQTTFGSQDSCTAKCSNVCSTNSDCPKDPTYGQSVCQNNKCVFTCPVINFGSSCPLGTNCQGGFCV